MARIDSKLNIVVPLPRDSGTIYIHSTPLSREVFETYYMVIAKSFSALFAENLNVVSGPRVAALVVKTIAKQMGVWEGAGGVQGGLFAEIRRLTNVLMPTEKNGLESFPFQALIDKKILDEDEIAEVESLIVFFILNSAMHRKQYLPRILEGMCDLWAIQTTQLNATEYLASLRTSTEAGSFGETAAA